MATAKYSIEGNRVCRSCGEYLEKWQGKWYCIQLCGGKDDLTVRRGK